MKNFFFLFALLILSGSGIRCAAQPMIIAQAFTIGSVTGYPFPSELTAAAKGSRIALAVNEQGRRNIYVTEGPAFHLRRLTDFSSDEGQEITSIRLSADGRYVVFVRGGDHGAYEGSVTRNPASSPLPPKVQVMSIPFEGGRPIQLDNGDDPVISPDGKRVAYIRNGQVWVSPIDGSGPGKSMFYARGWISGLEWSPDGRRIAFVASRGDHSLVGIFSDSLSPVAWLAPAFSRDGSPHWSPDGRQIVFVRRPASGGAPDSLTAGQWTPWSLWVAETAPEAEGKARLLWQSPGTPEGSVPETNGGYNLHWAAGDHIVFVSCQDGWPHIYSVPASGGRPILLTKGAFMAEHIQLSPDGRWLLFSANTGPDPDDPDRRHIVRTPVDRAAMEILTPGKGIESFPVATGDMAHIVMISATAQRPGVPAVLPFKTVISGLRLIGEELIPPGFPLGQLVEPRPVRFRAADGRPVYGQLFEPRVNGGSGAAGTAVTGKRPAIVFVHGGPERQMLLGWHYGDYYSNTYALNQYLVSRGFIVLSVNYRLGIGYGFSFQNPERAGLYGASEYRDIKAAGTWLAAQPGVDASRIGIYGGSYGGFLTALALGRDSKLFAAGVDIHGEHNYLDRLPDGKGETAPDAALAGQLIRESSPVSWLDGWTAPVLFIHGDDDGNVDFHQTVDMVRRMEKAGKPFESLMIPDETHHWLKYAHMLRVDAAVAEFLERHLGEGRAAAKKDAGLAPATSGTVPTPAKKANISAPHPASSGGLAGKTICIDAGHGGTAATDHYRQGPAGEREEWINLRVAFLLKKMLEDKGASVILTRQTDSALSLSARATAAVAGKADLFISIHHNATADSSVNFPIIYFHGSVSENLAGVTLGKLLAQSFEKNFYRRPTPVCICSDYTIFPDNGAAVLRNTYGIPGVIAEASFFTNAEEESRLKQEAYNTREAKAYLDALEAFFRLKQRPEILPNRIAPAVLSFPVLQEADRMDSAARAWALDFKSAAAVLAGGSNDTILLKKAYEKFSRSAASFPDSYVAGQCHAGLAEILARTGRPEEAAREKTRATEFYILSKEINH